MIHLGSPVRDVRGLALPLALLSLLLFTSLALVLISVAQTEPTIASNHLRAAQARASAESGIARAAWALTQTGAAPGAGPFTIGDSGRFELTVTGTDPHARVVRAVGASAGARATVIATLVRVRDLARDAPCALCVGAPVTLVAGVADARGSETTGCAAKVGVASAGGVTFGVSAAAYGGGAPEGTPTPVAGRDWRADEPLAVALSTDDLQTLRALAVVRGRYVRPTSDAPIRLTDLAEALVFVDTPVPSAPLTAENVANVSLGPGRFRGWLIVNGNLALDTGADVEGLVYAMNAITTDGPARVSGLVIARHALGGEATLSGLGIRFDCAAARIAGASPQGWFVRPGTYCDGTAGC